MAPPSIYVIGAQCTGKTTLVNALEAHFSRACRPGDADWRPPAVVREVARSVLRDEGFGAWDLRASPARALALQRRVLAGQARAEAAATTTAADDTENDTAWILADRSALDAVVYARQYGGGAAAGAALLREPTAAAAWPALRNRLARALVVVCEAGANWLVDDGVRLMPADRAEWLATHREFVALLAELRLPSVVLPCTVDTVEARVAFVLERWEDMRARTARA